MLILGLQPHGLLCTVPHIQLNKAMSLMINELEVLSRHIETSTLHSESDPLHILNLQLLLDIFEILAII